MAADLLAGSLASGLNGLTIGVTMSVTASFIWFGGNPDSEVPKARFAAAAALDPIAGAGGHVAVRLPARWRRSRAEAPRAARAARVAGRAGASACGSSIAAAFGQGTSPPGCCRSR